MILNQTSQRFPVRRRVELLLGFDNFVCFRSCLMILRKVQVNFVSIEISVERRTIGVVHANGSLPGKDASAMGLKSPVCATLADDS